MIFPTKKKWDEWEIDQELHKFFLLRWQEIFNETTFDSWQVRSCNLESILVEILETVNTVDMVHSAHPNISFLIEEAKLIAKDDVIIKKHYSFVPGYLKKLKIEYENNIKNENKKNGDFRKLVKVIIGNLATYRTKLIARLTELISNPIPDKFKKEIYALTMALGVEIKTMGYSTNSLQESFSILTNKENGTFSSRFEKIIEKYSGQHGQYLCHFFISWPGGFPNFPNDNIQFIQEHPDFGVQVPAEVKEEFFKQDSKALIAKVTVESLDHYSARMEAARILESLFSMNMLYLPTKRAVIKHKKAFVIEEKLGLAKCVHQNSSLKYIRDAKDAQRNVAELWEATGGLEIEDAAQLSASLQYHKSALLSPTDQAKLVNLWIALESLVQQGGKNIIDRITKYIPASVSTGYVYLLTKAIPIDISRFWKKTDTSVLRSKLTKSSKYILHPYDLLKILTDEKDGELITEFLNLLSENPLLIYRISNLWGGPFSSQKELRSRLERHKNNILWQLRRIYRLRNHVMHKGLSPKKTRQLIHHLHSYYIITIHNLIHDLKINKNWGISEALEHRYQLYEQLDYKLKKRKVSLEGLFTTFSILFDPPDESIWKGRK